MSFDMRGFYRPWSQFWGMAKRASYRATAAFISSVVLRHRTMYGSVVRPSYESLVTPCRTPSKLLVFWFCNFCLCCGRWGFGRKTFIEVIRKSFFGWAIFLRACFRC